MLNAYLWVNYLGLSKAVNFLEDRPKGTEYFLRLMYLKNIQEDNSCEYWNIFSENPNWEKGSLSLGKERLLTIVEVEQAIDDFELVDSLGGIEKAKRYVSSNRGSYKKMASAHYAIQRIEEGLKG